MICEPCGTHADDAVNRVRGELDSVGHDPAICRDAALQPHGCPCAHRPVGTATTLARGAQPHTHPVTADTETTSADRCTQCGQLFSHRACGPTHAIITAERGIVDRTYGLGKTTKGATE